ncbi:MAG: hypothetical protein HXX18_01040 [Bacteroidetes bacterium]|nr:hypothetical protein [Bacteroidota bacterium]
MPTEYKFLSDTEPTDEQLSFLMQDVAIEVKKKAQEANTLFLVQLQQMIQQLKNKQLNIDSI